MADDLAHPMVREGTPPGNDGRVSPYRRRFTAVFVALGMVVVAAAVGTALVARTSRSGERPWSSWRPTKDGTEGEKEIAEHVAREYRLGSGRQLVAVLPSVPKVANSNLDFSVNVDGERFADGPTTPYIECGRGDFCSISDGRPSEQRALLLDRQALELALYTFHYIADTQSVVVFEPPSPGSDPSTWPVLLFERARLRDALSRPLAQTLPGPVPTPGSLTQAQSDAIVRLTDGASYTYQFQQLPDSSAQLVLKRP